MPGQFAAVALAATLAGTPAAAAVCADLALVLAFDASGSVDEAEFALQLHATADAFRDAEVQRAIRATGTVAVAAIVWGDSAYGTQTMAWDLVDGAEGAERVARRLETQRREVDGNTDLGTGLAAALDLIEATGDCAPRRVVNISGDGRETTTPRRRHGVSIMQARRRAEAMNVTVNGLAIESEDPDLDEYYRNAVITGPDAFVMAVNDHTAFAEAMRRKLIREIEPIALAAAGGLAR